MANLNSKTSEEFRADYQSNNLSDWLDYAIRISSKKLEGYSQNYVNREHVIRTAASDGIIKAYMFLDTFDGTFKFTTWFYTIISRKAQDEWEKACNDIKNKVYNDGDAPLGKGPKKSVDDDFDDSYDTADYGDREPETETPVEDEAFFGSAMSQSSKDGTSSISTVDQDSVRTDLMHEANSYKHEVFLKCIAVLRTMPECDQVILMNLFDHPTGYVKYAKEELGSKSLPYADSSDDNIRQRAKRARAYLYETVGIPLDEYRRQSSMDELIIACNNIKSSVNLDAMLEEQNVMCERRRSNVRFRIPDTPELRWIKKQLVAFFRM